MLQLGHTKAERMLVQLNTSSLYYAEMNFQLCRPINYV